METDNNLANVTMVCVYGANEAEPSDDSIYAKVLTQLYSRMSYSPIFTRKLKQVLGNVDYPYWVEDPYFALETHLHHHTLDKPGGLAQFRELIGKLHSQSLDMRRPLWEMHIVESINDPSICPAGGFALITKIHHAAIDGAATMQFFGALSDLDPTGTPALKPPTATKQLLSAPSNKEMLSRSVSNHISSPVKFTKTLAQKAPGLIKQQLQNKRSSEGQPSEAVPVTLFNQSVSPNKTFASVEFSLDDLKSIQRKVENAKLNDVVLAITSGAMTEYLSNRNALPSESLVAWVPINARPSGKSSGNEEPGNHVTAMTTPLGSNLSNPLDRLAVITENTRASKLEERGMGARLVTDLSQHLPGLSLAVASKLLMATGAAAKLCNVTVSNVPGFSQPMYLAGAQCIHQYGLVPLAEGMGLFVVTISNNGIMSFSVTSTKDIIPNMDEFCDCLQNSFEQLINA
jgi:WS/DGAT/MGAT family acyltransferase